MVVPTYLTRYYQKGEYPFMSLNDLPHEEANAVKLAYCKKTESGFFTPRTITCFTGRK